MNAREQNGLLLAAVARITPKNGLWVVPSQTTPTKTYLVNLDQGTCTCPDHGGVGRKCKHIYAAEFVSRRESGRTVKFPAAPPEPAPGRKTYSQNWTAYNMAQRTEKHRFQVFLHELCRNLKTPPQKAGRPRVPMSDLVFASVFKVYSTLSSRRFHCDLEDAKAKGYVTRPINTNNIGKYLDWPPVTEALYAMIEVSSLPLRVVETDFAVDSTGFSSSRFVRWFDEKYGTSRSGHDWVKAHVMAGVRTHVVTAVEIRERHAHDAPLFGPLVLATARNFQMRQISADKGYSSEDNINLAFDAGATPYILFRDNAITERGGLWEKSLRYYQLHREEYLDHYHKRSNVESVFSMIKAKFRDHVRSRTDRAMKAEVLCKILSHNICCLIQSQCELGIEPVFWPKEPPSPFAEVSEEPADKSVAAPENGTAA